MRIVVVVEDKKLWANFGGAMFGKISVSTIVHIGVLQ